MKTNRMFKKSLAMLLSLIMILSMAPLAAVAEGESEYLGGETIAIEPLPDTMESQSDLSDTEITSDVEITPSLAETGFIGIQASSSGADPGLDLLLAGYNMFGGTEFCRNNTIALVTPVGRATLEQVNNNVGFMNFTGGNRASYQFYAASNMEYLAKSKGLDIFESVSRGIGYENEVKVGAEVKYGPAKFTAEQVLKASAKAGFTQTNQNTSNYSYANSYENFFSVMEIRRELGRNHIIDVNSLRTNNALYWNALSQDAKDALLGVGVSGSNMDLLFSTYGTHIITSYNFGGRTEHYTSIIRTASQSEESIMSLTGNGSSGGINILGLQASVDKNKTTIETAETLAATGRYEYSVKSYVFGGNMSLGSALDPKSDPVDFDNWLNSISPADPVNTTEVFVDDKLELVGIWELLPPGNEARQAEIQKAFLDKYRSYDMNFFENYIYNVANIIKDMEKPQYDSSYYPISTAAELAAIGSNATTLSRNYILTNDIDLSGSAFWTPIGSQSDPFTGRFEGNGCTVSGVQVAPNSPAPGLFGYNNGTIRYLSVIYSSRYGGVAGASNGTITDCYAEFAHKSPTQTIEITNTTTIMPTFATVANSTVLLDFTNRTTSGFSDMSIIVPSTVQTVIFRGVGIIYTSLNVAIQGNNTDVVFENFNFRGTSSSTATAALYFTGSNPGLILRGTSNTITGYGRYANSNGSRSVVEANGNLYICGNADFTVVHDNTYSSSTSGDFGKNAIGVVETLDIALGAALTAKGGDGRGGSNGSNGSPGADNFNGWKDGEAGKPGYDGSSGGNGGNGISTNKLNILNNSSIIATGGDAGNGGDGGTGGKGGRGGDAMVAGNGGIGGAGGYGGTGGRGGKGGTPLVAESHNLNEPPLQYYLNLNVGKGGVGGSGGYGGYGGQGGATLNFYLTVLRRNSGGDGGRGGAGGVGGYHGLLDIVGGINETTGYYYTAAGGTGGYGGSGGFPNGISYTSTRASSGASTLLTNEATYLTKTLGQKSTITLNTALWTTILNQFTIGIGSPNFVKLSYYPGDIFDPSGFVFMNKNGSTIPYSSIDFKYDFSSFGQTLVTATYYVGSVAIVRYIPVKVERPTVDSIELFKPARTQFYIGQDFDSQGIAIDINYSDGHTIILTDGITVTPPEDVTSTAGTKTVSVSRPAYEGTFNHPGISEFSSSYQITVENDFPVKLEVINKPTVIQMEGNVFNSTGMSFRVEYMSGAIDTIYPSSLTFSHGLLSSPNPNFPITATYSTSVIVSCTFTVEVLRDPIIRLELSPTLVPSLYAGDIFNPVGLTISAVRESSRKTVLPWSDIDVQPDRTLLQSDNELTFIYFDAIGGNFITLHEPITVSPVVQIGIEISQMPTKQNYIEGDSFDSEGMIVDRVFNNGNRESGISGYGLSHGVLSLNDSFITITDNGFEEFIPVFVREKRVTTLEYTQLPTKTEYEEGEYFDPAGMVVQGTYDNGYIDYNVMGYDYYPDRPLIVEDTEVIISYGGESTNIPITVTPVKPTGVTLNRTALTLFVGYSGIILETVLPDNAADKKVTWSSDDLTVASVDEFGVVTALAEGTAIITATTIEGDFSASCRIDVVLETSSLITVSSATALRDKTVTVNIDIENNPGFAGMTLKVSFPKELTLTRYDLGDMDLIFGFTGPDGVLPGAACDISDQLYLVWGRTSNYTQDGTIVTLTFSIANDAQPGEYPVLVTFEQHNGPRTPVNLQETPLDIYIMDGTIIALRCILGNVTDSGEVGPADLVRLARWIAGHQGVYINEFAADITGRGEIGPADLVRLARWIAGHFGDMTLEELRTRPDTGGSQ